MLDLSPKIKQILKHVQQGRFEQARLGLVGVLRQNPADVDSNNAMAVVLIHQNKHAQARFFAERAAVGAPDDPVILANLGTILSHLAEPHEAIRVLTHALRSSPTNAAVLQNLANACWSVDRFSECMGYLERLIAHHPDDYDAIFQTVTKLSLMAEPERGLELCERALARAPLHTGLNMAHCATLLSVEERDTARVLRAHRAHSQAIATGMNIPARAFANSRDPERVLKVGFVSPDFRSHSVGFFVEPVLQHLDRARFSVCCYSNNPTVDEFTARFKSYADGWRQIETLTHAAAAEAILRDRIDILVDLAGVTIGNCLPLFTLRPAPVQVTYLGYAATSGVASMHYRFVDSNTDPPGLTEAANTEELVRLDPCFLCFRPPTDAPEPAPPPSAGGKPVTFVSFNSTAKLSRTTMRMWSRVLAAVPGSRLVLKAQQFHDEGVRRSLTERFETMGVAHQRLELLPSVKGVVNHLEYYARGDIALDPFPYHGTTTTCEALWMGVPVVTREGGLHAGRVGVTLLRNVGLDDLIARDEDEYVAKAAALAGDAARLAELRRTLRPRMAASPIVDAPGLARRFGDALRAVWRRACAQGFPEGRA